MIDRTATLETLLKERHAEIPLYLIDLRSAGNATADIASNEGRALLREHFLYWWQLESEGKLIAAGPVSRDTPQVRGLAIVAVSSMAEARRLAEAEPFHRAGWRVNSVSEWQLNEGLLVGDMQARLSSA